ncbi:MAG: fibronectin type III domain-containing protein [Lacibacter sp.]
MKRELFLRLFNIIILVVVLGLISACKKKKIPIPSTPSSLLAAGVSTSQINLVWTDNATNETGYKIERKTGSSAFAEIGSVNSNTSNFSDVGLAANTIYTYRIYAYNGGGNSASYSNEDTAKTFEIVPDAATGLNAAVLSHSSISIAWTDNATNESGYKIERKTGNGTFSLITTLSSNSSSYIDNGLIASTQYTYRVISFNSGGNGAYSNEAIATTIPDITTGLLAYFPFSGNAGDSSGNSNHGNVYGATLTSDRFGAANKAYYFNASGCSSYILSTINTSSIQTALTISVWVNRVGDGCSNPRFLDFSTSFGGSTIAPGVLQWVWTNSNSTTFESFTSNNTQVASWSSFVAAPNNSWTHLVYTNDGTTARFYQGGLLVQTLASSGNPILGSYASIGRMNHPNYDAFNGKVDDLRIYNRVLNQTEINYIFAH